MSSPRTVALVLALLSSLGSPALANDDATRRELETRRAGRVHVVAAGETLWDLARVYGCSSEELSRRNRLDGTVIHPGTELRIPRCDSPSATPQPTRAAKPNSRETPGSRLAHSVEPGDSLYVVAQRYGCTVDDLRVRNGLTSDRIRPGDVLAVSPGAGTSGAAIVGQSVGAAHAGTLIGGTRLAAARGVYIRRPERAWGANHTVFNVKRAIAQVRAARGKLHALAIGDLSARRGGQITEHRSHQSGRDVDIGFFYAALPSAYPEQFVPATPGNLDFAATFELVAAFAAMAGDDSGVERIFLGYDTQELLYRWARERQVVSPEPLERMFQYPYGPWAPTGLVRHEPGHDDHMHVRFKCPARDEQCR